MSPIQQITIHLEGVGTVLKSRRFQVPTYQRGYAWEAEHVEALLADISDAITSKEKEYFLGSMVVTSANSKRLEVVDGQQRLTTVSLIILAIKEKFLQDKDHDVVASLNTDFLASSDRRTKEREPKLILNEVDNEIYQDLIEDYDATINKKGVRRPSHKRLIAAAKQCSAYIQKVCLNSKDSEEDLHTWLDYIEKQLKIIVVIAPDDSNAFVIFETLNDRGLDLAISDLVKNYLFHKSSEKIEETKNRWLSMVSTLESATDDPLIVAYIRHFSMAKYGLIREKDLFSLLKKKITSKRGALNYSTELADSVRGYSALINTDHDFWNTFPTGTSASVATFNLLGMTQIRPLLLAILDSFTSKQVAMAFKSLVAVAVRYQLVGGVGGGTLERLYSETAKAITEGKITKSLEVISELKTVPSDSAFEAAFAYATVSKPKVARYFLRELEIAKSHLADDIIPDIDPTKVNLEHVLPQSPADGWKDFDEEEWRTYHKRLGNMAIMSSGSNSDIGNASFSKKKSAYKDSSFYFTEQLSSSPEWTKDKIESRQKEMAQVAVKHWKP
ncbi:DUF262 domain-containing protein [Granulosicoccus sp. 3-233]|uniref:DUF262 domain-containing protein n=1 Tax=Granulosicoccus sp. 3-233 TaxID=3417969 RepID=UPI003D336E4D